MRQDYTLKETQGTMYTVWKLVIDVKQPTSTTTCVMKFTDLDQHLHILHHYM